MAMRMRIPLAVLGVFIISCVCAPTALAYKKVNVRYFVPPVSPLPRSIESLAILDFSGSDGDKFADSIIRGLLNESTTDLHGRILPKTMYFEIIERSRLGSILREQNLGTTGTIDEASAAELGRVAGVDAVFVGELTHNPKVSRTIEQRTQDKQTYNVQCVTNSTQSSFNGRIIDVDTGKILTVFDIGTFSGESKACGESSKPTSHSDQIEVNNIRLMARIVTELVGTVGVRERELEKVKAAEFKETADKAAEFAESGNIKAAYVIYKTHYDADPYSEQAAYNLGVMHESVGNYAKALELYNLAASLKPDEKDIVNAQRECSHTVTSLEHARSVLGFEYPEFEFVIDAASLARATSTMVMTAGGRDKRHQIFDGPAGSGTIRIPGSLELVLLDDQGGWVKIALPDGKEGWIEEASIDGGSLKSARKKK